MKRQMKIYFNLMCNFDVIIPTSAKEVAFVPRVMDLVFRCLKDIERVYILTAKKTL